MMILPLADSLQNCFQNLTSRIAGIDNEQMTNRVIGIGTMLGFGLGAIKEQFNTPLSTNTNGNDGLKGFIDRTKSVINPSINLSPEKDYNGNVNPIRDVLTKKIEPIDSNNTTNTMNNNISIPASNGKNIDSMSNGASNNVKSVAGKVIKTGVKATGAYLSFGAKMVEGDFDKTTYKNNNKSKNRRYNYQNAEYVQNAQKISNENNSIKSGEQNELRK